jgi:hypothetical protein
MKYLGIALIKEVKVIYNENYKTPMKENKKWKELPCSWISRVNSVKTALLLKDSM